MELDKICQNCSSFIQDSNDLVIGLGICVEDEVFEPFLDEIMENADFSNCYEIYQKKRFNGEMEACDQYAEPEIIEIPEGEDIRGYLIYENMKTQNVDEIIKYFYDSNLMIVNNAVSAISAYVHIGNKGAYEGLINYYMGLGPAESLEDVHLRIKIVDILSTRESENNTIAAYVNELARTPSNNTTRKLYSLILERLGKCPEDMTYRPLLELLEKRQYSYKIRKRIMEIAGI
jgi:hypothetical protein